MAARQHFGNFGTKQEYLRRVVYPQQTNPAEYGGILDEWYDHTKDPGRRPPLLG